MLRYYKICTVLVRLIIAFILYPLSYVFLKPKKYNIIGTRNGARGYDNAEYLLAYCKDNNIPVKVIYNDACREWELSKNSIKSILFVLLARNVYITHSESDILDYFWRFIPRVSYTFIQHGVIGIKKLPDYEKKNYHKYVSSCEYETEIFKKYFQLNDEKIIKSGLPRFDSYDNAQINKEKKVSSCLVMFTWRNSESARDELIESYVKIVSHLAKEELSKIYICVHEANLHTFKDSLEYTLELDERFCFIANDKLSNIIKKTELLITDYSSVSWDYLYQNKNILFYTPDIEDYKNTTGLYCDFSNFFGAHLNEITDVYGSLLHWIISENKINNERFITRYRFYNASMGTHSENIVKNTFV